jgi:hypothetical protein
MNLVRMSKEPWFVGTTTKAGWYIYKLRSGISNMKGLLGSTMTVGLNEYESAS